MNTPAETSNEKPVEKPAAAAKPNPLTNYEVYDADYVVPFAIRKKGEVNWYCIGHMSGSDRDKYLSEVQKTASISIDEEGNPQANVSDFTGMSTMTLQYCVYGYVKTGDNEGYSDDQLIPRETIAGWAAPLLDRLLQTATTMNALDDEGASNVGKDS